MKLNDDLLCGAKAAAEYLGESVRAVYHMAANNSIPHIQKGRKLYFRKSELNKSFTSEIQNDTGQA